MSAGDAPAGARLFLGLRPDRATRHAITAWRDRWTWPPGAEVVPDERLHLTLHFIGMVERSRLAEIEAGLALPAPRFEFDIGSAAIWPRGLALLQPLAVAPELRALQGALAQALRTLSLPVEARGFRPHVTLARHAQGAVPPAEPLQWRWPVAGYSLVESDHGYRLLKHWGA